MITALMVLAVPLAGLTALGFWARHMHERHGLGPLLWRFHTGMPLDGHPRTNATWLHRSSDVLHHTGHAVAWHHLPRLVRAGIRCGTELALAAAACGLIAAPGITIPVLAVLAAAGVAWGLWRAVRGARNWHFYWRWFRPLKRALELHHGVPPKLKIRRDRSRVWLSLPPGYADTQRERDKVIALVTSKLGIEVDPALEEDVTWRTRARAPHVVFRAAAPPPALVQLSDPRVRAAIASCDPAQIFAGYGRRGREIVRSVNSEAPMLGIGMPTGEGKSKTAGNAAAQLAAQGALVAVLDYKITSHRWAKGLPNAAYASRIEQIHQLLIWLEGEVLARNELIDLHADIDGNVRRPVGNRLVVITEELNTMQRKLAKYWRECRAADRDLPAKSPAVDASDTLLFTGRAALITDILIAQRLSAAAVSGAGGTADARENLCYRWLCDPGAATWRINGNDCPPPVPRGIKGRHYLVGPADVTEVQSVLGTNRELRDLAISGIVAEPPADMPFVNRAGGYARADDGGWTWKAEAVPVPELVAAGGPKTWDDARISASDLRGSYSRAETVLDAELVGEAVQAGAQEDRVTLAEAVEYGIAKVNLHAARRRSTRDPRHPRSVGQRGRAFLYDAVDLADYYAKAA